MTLTNTCKEGRKHLRSARIDMGGRRHHAMGGATLVKSLEFESHFFQDQTNGREEEKGGVPDKGLTKHSNRQWPIYAGPGSGSQFCNNHVTNGMGENKGSSLVVWNCGIESEARG